MKLNRSAATMTAVVAAMSLVNCKAKEPEKPAMATEAPAPGDSAFHALTRAIIDDNLQRHPSSAVYLGVHKWDAKVEDMSQAAIQAETQSLKDFRTKLMAVDIKELSPANRADRGMLLRAMDAGILGNESVRNWAKNPDNYSSGVTNAAYIMMKSPFAPAVDRLKSLIARERAMPAMLAEARKNLQSPPKIYTQIAIEQIDGNIAFFKNDVTAAFADVTDSSLAKEFRQVNDSVMTALADYKKWLQTDLLPKSTGDYAIGADTYRKLLAATEMIDMPLDELLTIAEADRAKNEAALQATAKLIDSTKSVDAVLAGLQADHPAPDKLLEVTQAELNSLRTFLVDNHIITVPASDPARVKETPPFMRSTTSASMDTPGPFEQAKLEGRYNMTLPDPRWPKAKQDEFMTQWYYAAITNVSVHEVYPGHYTQFLYAKQFPTDVRKVYGANTNSEGWAHYSEQMMLDEGLHKGEPKYRMAQLQDALLRDIRFIVGIKMHTQGMTVPQAVELFVTQGHQPRPVAESESKRGTSDALYGYYTMGKLMILKLREDYKAKMGTQYTLQKFHDEFIRMGPLPLPLVRQAMVGAGGPLF
ncbi:MAG: DUF885 domain-containing protein [Gemmatimonadaceae bacterium]